MENEQIPFLKTTSLTCSNVEELLDCYIDGEMITPLKERFEAHLAECEPCRDLVYDCNSIKSLASTLDQEPLAAPIRLRLREVLRETVGYNGPEAKPRLTLVK